MSNKGKTKVFVNGEWIEKKYEDIVKGDIYRGYKNNGHVIKNKDGKFVWLAIGDCIITEGELITEMRIPTWEKL